MQINDFLYKNKMVWKITEYNDKENILGRVLDMVRKFFINMLDNDNIF